MFDEEEVEENEEKIICPACGLEYTEEEAIIVDRNEKSYLACPKCGSIDLTRTEIKR